MATVTKTSIINKAGGLVTLRIEGTGFGASQGTNVAEVNNTSLTVTSWSDTAIEGTVADTVVAGDVAVTSVDGQQGAVDLSNTYAAKVHNHDSAYSLLGHAHEAAASTPIVAITAAETLSANTVVGKWSDNKCRKVVGSSSPAWTNSFLVSDATGKLDYRMCYIGGDKYIAMYQNPASGQLEGNVYNGGTVGPAIANLSQAGTDKIAASVCAKIISYIGNNKAVVIGSNYYASGIIYKIISGLDTDNPVATDWIKDLEGTYKSSGRTSVCTIGSSAIFLAFTDSSTNILQGLMISNIDTAPTVQHISNIHSSIADNIDVNYIGNDSVLITYKWSFGEIYNSKAAIVSGLSTSPVINSSICTVAAEGFSGSTPSCYCGNEQAVILTRGASGQFYDISILSGLHSAPTVTSVTPTTIPLSAYVAGIEYTGSGTFAVPYIYTGSANLLYFGGVPSGSINLINSITGIVQSAEYMSGARVCHRDGELHPCLASGGPGGQLFSVYKQNHPSYWGTLSKIDWAQTDLGSRFITYTAGAQNSVVIAQQLSDDYIKFTVNGVSFTAGNDVYIGTGSLIQSSANGNSIGKAITSSELIIKKP